MFGLRQALSYSVTAAHWHSVIPRITIKLWFRKTVLKPPRPARSAVSKEKHAERNGTGDLQVLSGRLSEASFRVPKLFQFTPSVKLRNGESIFEIFLIGHYLSV